MKWAKEHKGWTIEDWLRVIWTDKVLFETGSDTRSCYVTRRKNTEIESQYWKPIFKSERSTISIWEAIALRGKSPVHFLRKEGRINSDVYINQVLKQLGLRFYNKCVWAKDLMIWMDDGTGYHTSKATTVYRRGVGLIWTDWPAKSPDLNPIENLWRIIKIWVSGQRYRIHLLESMKEVIVEEWKKLTEEEKIFTYV